MFPHRRHRFGPKRRPFLLGQSGVRPLMQVYCRRGFPHVRLTGSYVRAVSRRCPKVGIWEIIAIAHEGQLGTDHRRESAFPAEWRKSCGKARARILRISIYSHFAGVLWGDIFLFGLHARASSHCAPNVGPLPMDEGDHFPPHTIVCCSP